MMIVGTYHMANPGRDRTNLGADDVFSDRRQREISQVVERLGRFHPTKIMVEAAFAKKDTQEHYEDWLAGKYQLTRNEIDQLAFRLARAANLTSVNPVDYPMLDNGLRFDEVQFKPPTDSGAGKPHPLSAEEQLLGRSSVAEYLTHLNSDAWIEQSRLPYMRELTPDRDSIALYGGADALAFWYKRNFRILENVVRETQPGDRDMLLIGAGHQWVLREMVRDMPGFCIVDPLPYLTGSHA